MKPLEDLRPKIEVTLPEIRQAVRSFLETSESHGVRCIDLEGKISELLLSWIPNNQKILLEELSNERKNIGYHMDKLFYAIFNLLDPILTEDRVVPNKRVFALNAWIYALFQLFREKFYENNS